MSCVFIFSNTFSAKTIIYNLDYLFNTEIKEIVLLKENHRKTEHNNYDGIKVSIYDTLYECILRSDFIIILQNDKMPQRSISTIKLEAKRENKKCYVLKDVWNITAEDTLNNKENNNFDFSNYPVIAHISLGNITQMYCTEIALNKVMKRNNVNIRQFFSNTTSDLLIQLDKYGILNKELSYQINSNTEPFDIVIYSINVGASINNIIDYINFFKQIRADYVILQVERNFFDYKNATNIVKYCCFSKLDKIIKSHFTIADGKYILYCNETLDFFDNVYDVESNELGDLLFHSIITKLSLPKGILRL